MGQASRTRIPTHYRAAQLIRYRAALVHHDTESLTQIINNPGSPLQFLSGLANTAFRGTAVDIYGNIEDRWTSRNTNTTELAPRPPKRPGTRSNRCNLPRPPRSRSTCWSGS